MRTTLDLDPRVMAMARARVAAGLDATLGAAVSHLALSALDRGAEAHPDVRNGIALLPSQGRVVTDEMVADALLDD